MTKIKDDFKKEIRKISNKLGEVFKDGDWSCKTISISNESEDSVFITLMFSTMNYSFLHDIKLYYTYYNENDSYKKEIGRQLSRLTGYNKSILELIDISKNTNIVYQNKWNFHITKISIINPVTSEILVTFYKKENEENISFIVTFNLYADNFQNTDRYINVMKDYVNILNAPIVFDINYYKSLITQEIY